MEEPNSARNNQNHHAVLLPLHLQGHINPFIQLSLRLASRGFTVTFITYEHIHEDITRAWKNTTQPDGTKTDDIFEGVRAGPDPLSDPLDIQYRVVSDGLPVDYDRKGRLEEYLEWFMTGGFYGQVEKAVGEIVLESKPCKNLFVADTFYSWASKIAEKLELYHASFWTPALVFNQYYHVHLLRHHGHFDCPDPRTDPINYLPGVKSIDPKDLVSYF